VAWRDVDVPNRIHAQLSAELFRERATGACRLADFAAQNHRRRPASAASTAKGVDLARLDFVVMSHRHGDHMGGMSYLLSVNPKVRIYAPKEGFGVYGADLPSTFYRKDESLPAEQRSCRCVWQCGRRSDGLGGPTAERGSESRHETEQVA
jgi:hypothetical protein